jgi:NADH:ubiquinone oxidoreductase subunit H
MWDLKLEILSLIFSFIFFLYDIIFEILNIFDLCTQNGFELITWKTLYQFPQNSTCFFVLKFCLAIGFLILIRGGTPRYRYDYLTKLGWLKFLNLIILIFFLSIAFFFIF